LSTKSRSPIRPASGEQHSEERDDHADGRREEQDGDDPELRDGQQPLDQTAARLSIRSGASNVNAAG